MYLFPSKCRSALKLLLTLSLIVSGLMPLSASPLQPPVPVADTLNVKPKEFTLPDKGEQKLEITDPPTGFDLAKLVAESNDYLSLVVKEGAAVIVAKDRGPTTSKAVTTLKLTYPAEPALEAELKVTIEPRYKNLKITSAKASATPEVVSTEAGLDLKPKESRAIEVSYGEEAARKTLTAQLFSEKESVVAVTGNKLEAKAVVNAEETRISVRESSDPKSEVAKFQVRVGEVVTKIELKEGGDSIQLQEGENTLVKFKVRGLVAETLPAKDFLSYKKEAAIDKFVNVAEGEEGFAISALTLDTNVPVVGKITFSPKVTGTGGDPKINVNITVIPRQGFITFDQPAGNFLLPGGVVSTTVTVRGKNGEVLGGGVNFALENETDNLKWVTLSPEGNKLNVYWNEPTEEELTLTAADGTKTRRARPNQVKINVTAYGATSGKPIHGKIIIRMGQVSTFAPLNVKLNIMDARTVSDLYGTVTSNEYHVLTVRLFNDLKDDRTKQYTGASILAYSGSIEVAVGLEKKFDNKGTDRHIDHVVSKDDAKRLAKQRSDTAGDLVNDQARANDAAAKQIQKIVEELRLAELEVSMQEAMALKLEIEAKRDKDKEKEAEKARQKAKAARDDADKIIDRLAALRKTVRQSIDDEADLIAEALTDNFSSKFVYDDGKWRPVNREDLIKLEKPGDDKVGANDKAKPAREDEAENKSSINGDPVCQNTITYRPYTFEMIVNTVDRRDERSLRSKVFKLLDLLGTGTSFITAVAVPPSSSDLPLGLEKYSNLLLPGLEEIFPSMKEQHRQNIVSQVMKQIEEIPFGSDITRVIFIPKKSIKGLIGGHEARISEVCPFYFRVRVAIVTKSGTVQSGNRTP